MLKRTPKPTKPKPTKTAKSEPQEYRKPRADVYTVLLVIALLMLITGTAALWMLMKGEYEGQIKGGPNPVWNRPPATAAFDAPRALA